MKSLGFKILSVYSISSFFLILIITMLLSLGYLRLQWENMQLKADAIARDILFSGRLSVSETKTDSSGQDKMNIKQAVGKLRTILQQNTEGFLIVSARDGLIASSGNAMLALLPDSEQIARIQFHHRFSGEEFMKKSGLLEYIFYAPLNIPALSDSILIFVVDFTRRSGDKSTFFYYAIIIPAVIIIFQLVLGAYLYRMAIRPVKDLAGMVKKIEQGSFTGVDHKNIREIRDIINSVCAISYRKTGKNPKNTTALLEHKESPDGNFKEFKENGEKERTVNFFSRIVEKFSISIFYNGPFEIKRYCKSFCLGENVKALVFWGVNEGQNAQGIITVKITHLIKKWIKAGPYTKELSRQLEENLETLFFDLKKAHFNNEKLHYLLLVVQDARLQKMLASSMGSFRFFTVKNGKTGDKGSLVNALPHSSGPGSVHTKIKKLSLSRGDLLLVMNRELFDFVEKKNSLPKRIKNLFAGKKNPEPGYLLQQLQEEWGLNRTNRGEAAGNDELYCTLIQIV